MNAARPRDVLRGIADVIAASEKLREPSADPTAEPAAPTAYVPRCEGACGVAVVRRGKFCDVCADLAAQRLRVVALGEAYDSVSLAGALAWCRAELPDYATATAKARAAVENLPESARPVARGIVGGAWWKREMGSLVILGPTGLGKTRVLVAIGHRILDYALRVGGEDVTKFARGIRMTTGLDLARAQAQHKLGDGEPPLVLEAKAATMLIVDEVGFESTRFDPDALRDVVYARFDRGSPTLIGSGCSVAELEERYGAACMRRLWEPGRGVLVDLHPRAANDAGPMFERR